MINIESIEDTLYTWVFGITGGRVIFTPPNAPRPALPYVIIDVSQTVQIGLKESRATLLENKSIDVEYSTVDDIFLSINTYGAGAFTLATKLKDSLGRVTVTDQLFAGGLGFHKASVVNKIPEEINKQFEERAQFDCFFFIRSLDEENIETIQKIEITNNINDNGYTTTIEKP